MKKLSLFLFLMLPTLNQAFTREAIIISSSTILGAGIGAAYYFRNKPSDKPIDKARLVGSILLGGGCGILGGGLVARIIEVVSEKKTDYSPDIQALEERIKREWEARDQEIKQSAATTKKLLKEQQNQDRAQNQKALQKATINLRESLEEQDFTKQAAAQEELKLIPGTVELLNAHEEALNNVNKTTESYILQNNQAFSEKMAVLDPTLSKEELEDRFAEIDQKYGLK